LKQAAAAMSRRPDASAAVREAGPVVGRGYSACMHRSLRAAGAMIGCPWLGVAVLVSLSLFGGGCAHQTPALDVPAGAIGVMRADGSITLDGKLDEPAWRRAPASEAFVAPINRGETALADDPAYRTTVRVLHDGSTLYVAFECEGPPFWADRTKHDDHLYQQDVVEIFLDVKGDMREYIELHTSPIGTKGDAYHRWSQPPTYPADQLDWAQVRAHAKLDPEWALEGFEAGTRALEDGRQGFVVEAAVPLAGLLEGRGRSNAGRCCAVISSGTSGRKTAKADACTTR
jgi:hypothetical protein